MAMNGIQTLIHNANVEGASGHSHFALTGADVAELLEVQATARVRIAEMRAELEAAEAELGILDDALAEAPGA